MKKAEKSGDEPAEKGENLSEKLKNVDKRGGYTTPVIPFWRLEHHHHPQQFPQQTKVANVGNDDNIIQEKPFCVHNRASAIKLSSTICKLDQYHLPLSSKMHRQCPPRLRRQNHRDYALHLPRNSLVYDDSTRGGAGIDQHHLQPTSPDMPGSGGSLRRQVAASLVQHHRALERRNRAIETASVASYGSSMEIEPYNRAVTPSSSVDIKVRVGDPSNSLKTSTELLKVLNRIWSLEEQHASNISLIKALKRDLYNARTHIKELMRTQQGDKQEIGELMKQMTEEKLLRKSKEHDQIGSAIQTVRDELQDERKLRKRSESLHRKLARDLHEVKTSLATAMNDLEKESKSRNLLEKLCDEFACGITDYGQELHDLRHEIDKDWAESTNHDRLILHVSESWIDARMQMKQEARNGLGETSIVDKLKPHIETFLQTKQKGKLKPKDPTFLRSSLESVPLNMAISTPIDEDDENNFTGSYSQCFELSKSSDTNLKFQENKAVEDDIDELEWSDIVNRKVSSNGKTKDQSPFTAQIKLEEQIGQAISPGGLDIQNQEKKSKRHLGEVSVNRKPEITKAIEDDEHLDAKNKAADEGTGLSSNFVIDKLLRRHYILSNSGSKQQENDSGFDSVGNSVWRDQLSPVRKWSDELLSHDHDTESYSRVPPELKENTLKAKLIEARSRGQRSRSRVKG